MNRIHYILILVISFAQLSCDSENALDCFQKTGEIIDKAVVVPSFHTIVVMDETDIYLSNASVQEVTIHAGKNLIPEISLEVINGVLTISNKNTCNWRRAPGNPGIYIKTNILEKIEIYDFADFYTLDTLKLDRLQVYSDGTGNFNLSLDIDSMWIESIYISNFDLKGNVEFLGVDLIDDTRFLARDLICENIQVRHRGSNTVELFPINSLTGTLESTGNLYYFNSPSIIKLTKRSTGKVFDYSGN